MKAAVGRIEKERFIRGVGLDTHRAVSCGRSVSQVSRITVQILHAVERLNAHRLTGTRRQTQIGDGGSPIGVGAGEDIQSHVRLGTESTGGDHIRETLRAGEAGPGRVTQEVVGTLVSADNHQAAV